MIKLDFINDEELTGALKNLISALLPHENFDSKFYTEILLSIEKYITLDEMPLEYSLLVKVLKDLSKIRIVIEGANPTLDRDNYVDIITSGIQEFVTKNSKRASEWLVANGGLANLDIAEQFELACSKIGQAAIELYDDCFELQRASSELAMLLLNYMQAFKSNAITESIRTQYEILSKSVRLGFRVYKGVEGAFDYSRHFNAELERRLYDDDGRGMLIDSAEKLKTLRDMNLNQTQRLCDYGIPVLDDVTPMLRSRLVTIVANPNVGKTLYACDSAAKLLMANRKVVFMCGETTTNKIYNIILSRYIKLRYGKFVTSSQISGIEDCSEEANRLINIASQEIAESGNLYLERAFTYDNIYEELKALYDIFKFDSVIIDHSASLKSARDSKLKTMKDRIDTAAMQMRDFKNDFPVCILVTSHTSVDAAYDLKKFVQVYSSPTRDSSILEKESDELFILYTTELLQEQSLIGMQVFKRRDKEAPRNHIILKVNKAVATFEYKDELQQDSKDEIKKDDAFRKVGKLIDRDEDSDDELIIDLLDD